MSVVFIKKQKLETLFMIVFIFAYAIQLLYVIFGLICASKYVYTAQKISESSIYNDYNKPKIWTKNSKNSEFAVL